MSEPEIDNAPLWADVCTDHTQNAVTCIDCGVLYMDCTECPEEPAEHGYTATYVTKEPLGCEDDDEYFHHGRKQYEYDMEMV